MSPAALEAGGGSATAAPATVAPPVVNFNARAQFRIRAAAWSRAGLSGGTVWIVGELDQQTKRLPAWSRGAQAEITVTGSDNAQVASQRLEIKPGESGLTVQLPDAGGMQSGDYTGTSPPAFANGRGTRPDRHGSHLRKITAIAW